MNENNYHPFWRTLYHDRTRQFWYLQAVGWLGLAVISFLTLTLWYQDEITFPHVAHTLLQSGLGVVLSLPLWHIFRLLWTKPILLRSVLVLASVVAVSLLWTVLRMVTFQWMSGEQDLWLEFGGWFFSSLFVFLCWMAFYHGIKYYQLFEQEHAMALKLEAGRKEEQLKVTRAESVARQAQLAMLRYQLNPHFLFNTLNAIAALVTVGSNEKARRMVINLSDFLRYSLENDPEGMVTLAEEITATQLYLEIEKTRFGDRLGVELEIAPGLEQTRVPSLLLQPLVENAVKYGIARRERGGRITIAAAAEGDRLRLSVADDGPGVDAPGEGVHPEGVGVGLRNARERLATLYGDRHSLDLRSNPQGGVTVVIALPLAGADARSAVA